MNITKKFNDSKLACQLLHEPTTTFFKKNNNDVVC